MCVKSPHLRLSGVQSAMPRFNVDFNNEANEILEDLAKEQGATKAEILRRAIALEKWFADTRRKGGKVLVETEDGKVLEVVHLR
jgi:hypothetical protein